jgi:type II secretory pathway predicted ATPase ExeA
VIGGVVMETEVLSAFTQFGVAGMVCAMWLIERRASGKREQQINEAHQKLISQLEERSALLEVVRDNTRALSMLEAGQRGLVDVLAGRGAGHGAGRGAGSPSGA